MDCDPAADPAFVLREIANRAEPLGLVAGREVRLRENVRLAAWPPKPPRLDGGCIYIDAGVFVIPREELARWAGKRLGVRSAWEALAIADRLKEMIAGAFQEMVTVSRSRAGR